MNSFQKTVSIVALVILFIALFCIGIALRNSKSVMLWPPLIANCPDYWTDLSGNGSQCYNAQMIGNTSTSSCTGMIDFTQPQYVGAGGSCAKYTWAKSCGQTWDGITYGAKPPCAKS